MGLRVPGWACGSVLILGALAVRAADRAGAPPADLASKRPATSSSVENDEHDASRANDGNPDTCWRADDEPEGGPDWWQVDLGKPFDLAACTVTWPYAGMNYRCKVEGSSDRAKWVLLSDQTRTTSRSRVQRLAFDGATGIRYLKVTITGFDDGCCASLSEVKVFGADGPRQSLTK